MGINLLPGRKRGLVGRFNEFRLGRRQRVLDERLAGAVHARDFDKARRAIEGGADVNGFVDNGWRPLQWAVLYKDPALVKLLVDNGGLAFGVYRRMVNPLGYHRESDYYVEKDNPVALAVNNGSVEILDYLVKHLPKGSSLENHVPLALHVAARRGYVELARYLVNRMRFRPNSFDKKRRTPLDVAKSYKRREVGEFILSKGGKTSDEFYKR